MTQRSNTSTRIRKQAGHSIFNCLASDLHSSETRYNKFRQKIGWVENNVGKNHYETWKVEILHKDYGGAFDINGVFLNPVLMKVSRDHKHRAFIHHLNKYRFLLLSSKGPMPLSHSIKDKP